MQKRFIAVSTAVVALALVFSFSARSTRADSIHSLDFDILVPVAGSCDLGCILDSAFTADHADFATLFSGSHGEFSRDALAKVDKDWSAGQGFPFGFPVASHFEHHEGDGNPRSSNVAEPGSLLLLSVGLAGLLGPWKSRRRNPPFPPAAV